MSWLVLLIVFWKPLYYLGFAAFKRDKEYIELTKDWFISLYELIKPGVR